MLPTPQPLSTSIDHRCILGTRVDAVTYASAADTIADWAESNLPRSVCAANVHMVMEGWDDPEIQRAVNAASMVTADGMPLVWALRQLGVADASRVYGPTLMLHVCEEAAARGLPVGLYGGRPDVLERLQRSLESRFPDLELAYVHSPPFRDLTLAEEADVAETIRASGARILFVGLGCPRQELWMHRHRAVLPLVCLGVGAAFDFHAGAVKQAPTLLQRMGLEWLFRLAMEPRRLWRRYARHNPRFVILFGRQLLRRSSGTTA